MRFANQIGMHLSAGDPVIKARLLDVAMSLRRRGVPETKVMAAALSQVRGVIGKQVAISAYNACFLEFLYVFGPCMAVALLLRAPLVPAA